MSSAVVRVAASAIRWKLSLDFRRDEVRHDAWSALPRQAVAETDKYRSVIQHFADGVPWQETPLFTTIYAERVTREAIRGCETLGSLAAEYAARVDGVFADLQAHGFRSTSPIPVYQAQDGELVIGNQGNHRLAMATVLGTDIYAEIVARHPAAVAHPADLPAPTIVGIAPDLPSSARAIPAMTTDAERLAYYRLARDVAGRGAVVELGAWLGAATAYLAAAMRDAGTGSKVDVFDRFIWKPKSHDKKAGGPLKSSQLHAFKQYLGPLLAHARPHACELRAIRWTGGPVALLVCDAPKRIPEISVVLSAFADGLRPGSLMAWQDFAYFPSYDIPAALIRMGDRVAFTEAVYPGTTAVFRVERGWGAEDVSPQALAWQRWTPDEVESAWAQWGARLPEPMRPRFACGAALFLCDLGATHLARTHLRGVLETHPDAVLPKWRALLEDRDDFRRRYAPLVEEIAACA